MSPVARYLLGIGIPYILRIALYSGVFNLRSISCSFINRLVIAGAFILVGLIPLPHLLQPLAMVGASLILVVKYTDTGFPDVLFISVGVEMTSILAMDFLISPLIF